MASLLFVSRILKGLVTFDVTLRTKTGLLIRMPVHAQVYRIGGADHYPMVTRKKYVLKTGETLVDVELDVPFIPGSSVKGRMRSLLELSLGLKLYSSDQKIWQHVRNVGLMDKNDFINDVLNRCVVDELFGYAAANYKQLVDKLGDNDAKRVFTMLSLTRLLVDDFYPSRSYVERNNVKSIADFLEEKMENRLDRITAAADPRGIVRVKPDVEFDGRLTLLLFDNDKDIVKKYLETIVTGLRLIEETYLGGSGSRGYGRVEFIDINVSAQRIDVNNGVPKLVDTNVKNRLYKNLMDLEKDIDKLSNDIVKAIYP